MAKESKINVKILVPNLTAGAIIGKGGEAIKTLKTETGAYLKISKPKDFYPETTERVCFIHGTVEACMKAHDYVMDKINEHSKDVALPSRENTKRHKQVKMLVTNSAASVIIGFRGSYIQKIKDYSQASIQISQKVKQIKLFERCIIITGELENRRRAMYLIFQKFLEHPTFLSYPNCSYANIMQPVASAYLTGPSIIFPKYHPYFDPNIVSNEMMSYDLGYYNFDPMYPQIPIGMCPILVNSNGDMNYAGANGTESGFFTPFYRLPSGVENSITDQVFATSYLMPLNDPSLTNESVGMIPTMHSCAPISDRISCAALPNTEDECSDQSIADEYLDELKDVRLFLEENTASNQNKPSTSSPSLLQTDATKPLDFVPEFNRKLESIKLDPVAEDEEHSRYWSGESVDSALTASVCSMRLQSMDDFDTGPLLSSGHTTVLEKELDEEVVDDLVDGHKEEENETHLHSKMEPNSQQQHDHDEFENPTSALEHYPQTNSMLPSGTGVFGDQLVSPQLNYLLPYGGGMFLIGTMDPNWMPYIDPNSASTVNSAMMCAQQPWVVDPYFGLGESMQMPISISSSLSSSSSST